MYARMYVCIDVMLYYIILYYVMLCCLTVRYITLRYVTLRCVMYVAAQLGTHP
jgi:hypothetical protein